MKSAVVIAALSASLAVGFGQRIPDLGQYRQDLAANPNSSLAHFRIAEILSEQGNVQGAANEFREALSGDLQPQWTEAWAHIGLAKIYDATNQPDRASNEYRLAEKTGDSTKGVGNAPAALLSRTDPDYSDEARLAELEGTVVVTGKTSQDGRATDLRVTRPLGLGLDEKAIEAVQRWRFTPDTNPIREAVDFSLSSKQSRWHLIGVDFHPPEGTSRPTVLSAYYPSGAGVFTGAAIEQGRLLGAIGRQSFVALAFEVDESGVPVHIQVARSSDNVWNDQAMAVLRGWRFTPGMKEGTPVSVPCTFEFAWGPRILGSREVSRILSALDPRPAPGNQVWRPEFINTPDPIYPAEARTAGLEGTVTVAMIVGEDGTPRDIQVTQGLGPEVDASVTKTLAQWRIAPPFLNGQAVSARLMIGVSFELPGHVASKILNTTPPFLAPHAIR